MLQTAWEGSSDSIERSVLERLLQQKRKEQRLQKEQEWKTKCNNSSFEQIQEFQRNASDEDDKSILSKILKEEQVRIWQKKFTDYSLEQLQEYLKIVSNPLEKNIASQIASARRTQLDCVHTIESMVIAKRIKPANMISSLS